MNLIFIYGPPGVGKLTVAKQLSKLTGYNILHNHLTVDLITTVLPFGTKDFFPISNNLRLKLFEIAAREKTNLIFTVCYTNPGDNKFVRSTIRRVKKHNGNVKFIHLKCKMAELNKRVCNTSRTKHKKLTCKTKLKKFMDEVDMLTPIPFVKSLEIDNTNLSPSAVAKQIKLEFKL
tara:strand:+ start:54283 stop:54810 length:528 start_codon:yes stop_codon:yes gene_type:complete